MGEGYKALEKNGDMLAENGNIKEALELYDKAIAEYPYDDELWIKKGNMLAGLKRFEEALECYDSAIYINPNREKAWHAKGLALHFLKRYDEAIECFDKAIDIHPDYDTTWHAKGVALFLMGRYEEALRHLQKALEIYPMHKNAMKLKEQCIEKLKEMGRSMEDIEAIASRRIKIVSERKKGGVTASVMSPEAKQMRDELEKKLKVEVETPEEKETRLEAEKTIIETQNLLAYLEKIGLKLQTAREMLIEAVASFEAKEYEDALDFAKKGRKAAEDMRSQHKKAVDTVADVWNSVREVMDIGGQCPETETLLDAARDNIKLGNYDRAVENANRAQQTVDREIQSVLKDIAQKKLNISKSRLEDLKNFYPDGNYRDLERRILGIDATILEGRHKRALELIHSTETLLEEEKFRAKRRVINQNLNTAQRLLLDARDYMDQYGLGEEFEKDFRSPEDMLSQAREEYQNENWDAAFRLSSDAKESARSLKRFVEKAVAESLLDEVKRIISVMQRDGMEITDEITARVKRIEAAVSDKVYVHAIELGSILMKELRELQKDEYQARAKDEIEKLERIVSTAQKANIDDRNLSGVLDDLHNRMREGDFGGILLKLDAIRDVIDDVKEKSIFKLAEDEIIRMQELITDSETAGIDVSAATDIFKKAQKAYLEKNYTQVIDYIEEADEIIKIRRNRYDKVVSDITRIKELIDLCEELGGDRVEIEAIQSALFDAQDALVKKDISTAEEKSSKVLDDVRALEERLKKRKALDMITKAPVALKELKDLGDPAEGISNLLNEARMSFEKQSYREAYDLASRVMSLSMERKAEILQNRLKNKADFIQSLISESKEHGLNMVDIEKELQRGLKLIQDGKYDEAAEALDPLEKKINKERMKDLVRSATDRLMEVSKKLSSMKRNGLPVADAEVLLNKAKTDLAMEKYSKCMDALNDTDSILDMIARKHEALSAEISNVEKRIQNMDDGADKVIPLLNTAKSGFEKGDFDMVEAMLAKAHSMIDAMLLEKRENMAREQFQSLKDGHKRLESYGYESEEIYSIIREADSVASSDLEKFEELVKKGLEILSERENQVMTKLSLDNISRLSQEIEDRRRRKIPVGRAQTILDDARRAAEFGRYEKAVELCSSADAELKSQDELLLKSNIDDKIRRAEKNIETLKSMGKEIAESVMNLLVRSRELMTEGRYQEADEAVEKVFSGLQDELITIKRQKAIDALIDAQTAIAEAAESDVETDKAEQRLEAARDLFEEGDFVGCMNLSSEAIDLLHGEADVQTSIQNDRMEKDRPDAQDEILSGTHLEGKADREKAELHIKLAEVSMDDARNSGMDIQVEETGLDSARKMMEEGNYEKAIAIAKDIRNRLDTSLRSYQDFMSEIKRDIMPKIYALKGRNIDTETVESLIKEAENKARLMDISGASTIVEKAIDTITALEEGDLRSIASEEINRLESELDIARRISPNDGNIEKAEGLLKTAKELQLDGDYRTVIDVSREGCTLISGLTHDSDGKKAEDMLVKVQTAITEARELGIQTIEADNLYTKAKEAYNSENYSRALNLLSGAMDLISSISSTKKRQMAQKKLSEMDAIRKGHSGQEALAAELDRIYNEADECLKHEDYDELDSKLELMKKAVKKQEIKSMEGNVTEIIDRVKGELDHLLSDKLLKKPDVKDVTILLEKSEKLMDIDPSKAISSAMEAERMLDKVTKDKLMKEIEDTLISTQEILSEAKGFGVNVDTAEEKFAQAKATYKSAEFVKSLKLAREAKSVALSNRRNCEDTLEIIKELNETIPDAEKKGIDLHQVKAMLSEAKDYIKKDMYDQALKSATKAKDTMTEVLDAHERTVIHLSELQNKWLLLKKKKVPTDSIDANMQKISLSMKLGKYDDAESLITESLKLAAELEAHFDEYNTLLNDVKIKIADLKNAGASVDEAGSLTKSAIELSEKGKYDEAIEKLIDAKELLIKQEDTFTRAKKSVDAVRQKLVEARSKGLNITSAEEKFSNIIKLMNRGAYTEAEQEARAAMKEILAVGLQQIINS